MTSFVTIDTERSDQYTKIVEEWQNAAISVFQSIKKSEIARLPASTQYGRQASPDLGRDRKDKQELILTV